MIKAILSDFDGTLINDADVYDSEVIPLIQKLKTKGIQYSLATGRAYFGLVKKVIHEIAPSPYHIVNGGGMIINYQTGETPWYRPISELSVKKVAAYWKKKNIQFSMESKECVYMCPVIKTPAYTDDVIIREFSLITPPPGIVKILVFASMNTISATDIELYRKEILNDCKDIEIVKFTYNGYYGCDITAENSTKHTAVLEYGQMFNLQHNELVAIGDGYNDYPLFTACGYKIAMANAPQELKDIADKIVSTVDNGGAREALEHILALSS